jgi:hypothetical protein
LDDKSEKNEKGGACSTYGGEVYVHRVLVGKPKVKRPLGRTRLRLDDNIKMDRKEMGYGPWTGSISLRIETDGGHFHRMRRIS